MTEASDILDFWLSDSARPHWFTRSDAFDALIRDRFLPTYEAARDGELDGWAETDEGLLALIIVLDQFPRNLFRNSPLSFATDAKALELAQRADAQGTEHWPADWRYFARMPFMHSESLAMQARGLILFHALGNPVALDYMQQHHDIIARFGRFPHRNAVLGRTNTAEETEFLKTHHGF